MRKKEIEKKAVERLRKKVVEKGGGWGKKAVEKKGR